MIGYSYGCKSTSLRISTQQKSDNVQRKVMCLDVSAARWVHDGRDRGTCCGVRAVRACGEDSSCTKEICVTAPA